MQSDACSHVAQMPRASLRLYISHLSLLWPAIFPSGIIERHSGNGLVSNHSRGGTWGTGVRSRLTPIKTTASGSLPAIILHFQRGDFGHWGELPHSHSLFELLAQGLPVDAQDFRRTGPIAIYAGENIANILGLNLRQGTIEAATPPQR